MAVIENIKNDVKEADSDGDGRVDFEDWKGLLSSRYAHLYTDQDVEEIGELFFVGTCGKPIKTTKLVRGICHLMQPPSDRPNPLYWDSIEDHRFKDDPRDHLRAFYTIQQSFDKHMLRYVEEHGQKVLEPALQAALAEWKLDSATKSMTAGAK